MGLLYDTLVAAGESFSQGVTGGMSNFIAAQDRKRRQELEDQDRERALASDRFKALQPLLAAQVETNPQGVAAQLPQLYQAFNESTGLNVAAPVIKGGVKPTVNPNVYDINTQKPMEDWSKPLPDFSNDQTKTGLYAALMAQKPKAPEPSYDHLRHVPGLGLVDLRSNKVVLAPKEKAAPASNPRLVQDPVTGQWFEPKPGMKTGVKPTTTAGGGTSETGKRVNAQNYYKTVNYLINKYGAKVTSAGRSTDEQAALYAAAVKKYGKDKARLYAAPPGSSYHEKKDGKGNPLAHDIYVDPSKREAFISEARSLGLDIGSHYGDGHIHTEPLDGAAIPHPPAPPRPEKPKEVKPFDEIKADKIVRNELGIRPGRRILPSKQAEYDKRMAARKRAHEAAGGKSEKDAFFDFLEKEM